MIPMPTTAVITDSAAALPPALAAALGVTVVPLEVTADGRTLREGELADDELVNRTDVSSAAPPPGAFAAAIDAAGDHATGVVVVTVASALSATHRAAQLGAELASTPATVIDSGTAAGAQALVVHAAATAASEGAEPDRTVAVARCVVDRVRLVGALRDLTQLVRSGRVPGLAGWAGDTLGLRPLFELRAGTIHRLRPARSDQAADARLLDRWRASRPAGDPLLHVCAVHAGAPERAERLLAAVLAEHPEPATSFISGFGQAMVANCGVGVGGLAWWWEGRSG